MLDKSKGLVLGPELVANGAGTCFRDNVNPNIFYSPGVSVIAGVTYAISFTISNNAGNSSASWRVNSLGGFTTLPSVNGGFNGTITRYFYSANSGVLNLSPDNALVNFSISGVSVRELRGNHATQSTAASRPVLSARVNLLTNSANLFTGQPATVSVSLSATKAVTGDNYSSVVELDGSTLAKQIFSANLPTIAGFNILSFFVKERTGERWIVFRENTSTGYSFVFSPSSGVFGGFSGGASASNVFAIPVSDGAFRVWCAFPATTSALRNVTLVMTKSASTGAAYAGDGVSGFDVASVMFETDSQIKLSEYQRVNTATDYDTAGFPLYLRTDGVDDSMVTNSIDFTGTDKMTVVAGVRKLSDAATGVFCEHGATGADAGSFTVAAPSSAGSYAFASRGSIAVGAAVGVGTYAAPIANVIGGIGNISGDQAILRVNGTQAASSTADQGAGNYGNYPLYLFRRGGTSLPFNGRFYGLIVRGAQSTDAQIAQTERWMNGRTRAY
jgi:hypothetical protein